MLANSKKSRGNLCIGVTKHGRGFRAMIRINNKHYNLGTFCTEKEAFAAYKSKKESAIKEFADKYRDQLPENVYNALYKYQVEITD